MINDNKPRDDKFNKQQGGQQQPQRPDDKQSQGQQKDAPPLPSKEQGDNIRK